MGKTVFITGANRGYVPILSLLLYSSHPTLGEIRCGNTDERVGLELTKAYLQKGWKVVATARDVSKMPKVEGDIVVVKLEVGEKGDAKKVRPLLYLFLSLIHFTIVHPENLEGCWTKVY